MYVVPKHLYEAFQNQGDRTVGDSVASINIRQLNNISDNVKASIQANDVTKGGQQRSPASGNKSPPGGGNLGGVTSAAAANFGQTQPSDATNFGQMRDGRERTEEFLPPPPPPLVDNDSPPTSLPALPALAGSSTQTDNTASNNNVTTQTDNDMRTVATQAETETGNVGVQTDNASVREEGVQATATNSNANVQTENNGVDVSTQAAVEGVSASTATSGGIWDFGNKKRRNAILANRNRVIATQTDFTTNGVSQDTQTETPPRSIDMGTQVSPPPPPAMRDAGTHAPVSIPSTDMGIQVSPPPRPTMSDAGTHAPVSIPGQDVGIQTNPTRGSNLSLASQLQINVPPSYRIARRTGTSSAQTDPPTAIVTNQPLARSARPSWTFKVPQFALARSVGLPTQRRQQQRRDQLAITYQPSPKKKTPVQKRKKRVPVKYTPEKIRQGVERRKAARRQLNLDKAIASGSTTSLPPATQSTSTSTHDNPIPRTTSFKIPHVTVRRRPVGLAAQRQQQRSGQTSPKKKRETKAPVKYDPDMITQEMMRRGIKRKKGERQAAFAARQVRFDEAVASQQPAANPTLPAAAAAVQPRWMSSKPAKRTATAAHLDTPLSKPKVGGKRGRADKGEKRSVPTTFTTSQTRKKGRKE